MKTLKVTESEQWPGPPEHLSERSKRLWQALVGTRVKSLGRLALFQSGLEALDRADAARSAVETQGLLSVTAKTGAVHVNPAVKIERESRAQFTRIWAALNLQWDPQIDGRDDPYGR